MKLSRTAGSACLAVLIATAASGVGPAAAAEAQAFPTRPIRSMVGSSAGTGADIFARIVAQGLTDI